MVFAAQLARARTLSLARLSLARYYHRVDSFRVQRVPIMSVPAAEQRRAARASTQSGRTTHVLFPNEVDLIHIVVLALIQISFFTFPVDCCPGQS